MTEERALLLARATWARVRARYAAMPHLDPEALLGAAYYGAALALRDGAGEVAAIGTIRREIHEEARRQDFLSRGQREEARRLEAQTGRYPAWAQAPLPVAEWDAPRPDVAALALRRLQREEVRRAVAALPAREALILRRLFWDGQDTAQVGRELGLHRTRVGQLRDRALARLREEMEE